MLKTIHLPNGSGDEGSIHAGAISPDGKKVAASGIPLGNGKFGMLVYLISLDTGEIEKTFKGHTQPVSSLDFSPDGKWLASSSYDGTALIYKIDTGEVAGQLKGHADRLSRVRFHPKDGRLATACKDGTIRIWTGGQTKFTSIEWKAHPADINDIVWNKDGTQLASGATEGVISIWTDKGKLVRAYEKKLDEYRGEKAQVQITSMAYSGDGKDITYGGVCFLGNAGALNLETGKHRLDLRFHNNTVMAADAKGELAVTAGGDKNEVIVWRIQDGSIVQKLAGSSTGFWNVAWADAMILLWGTENRGAAIPPSRRVEAAFHLPTLSFKPVPAKFIPAQVKIAPYTLTQPDFFTLQVDKNQQPHYSYKIPKDRGERIYSGTLLGQDRLLVGTSGRLEMVNLVAGEVVRRFVGQGGIVTAMAPYDETFFATASTDQILRIWRYDRDEPVLSFFVSGREWIAWTPEGYYAASASGERLMGWLVNNGHDKSGTYYPAIQFRQSLYQPEVIKNLFRAKGDLSLAMALAIRDKRKPIPAVNLSQVLPPAVRIDSPSAAIGGDGQFRVDKESFEIKATAQSREKNPVRSLRLIVDGRPYQGQKGVKTVDDPKPGATSAVWNVSLPPGKHTVLVQADNGVSKGLSAALEIEQAGEVKKPTLYVCAVGVDAYPGKLKLNFAASDAKSIATVLKEKTPGVFDRVEIKLFTDLQATRSEILKGLDWLGSVMGPQDVGIFYFSGHGTCDDDGKFHLVPVDVNPRRLAESCIPGDLVRSKLADMPGRLVAIFDACHSGATADAMPVGATDDLLRELVTDDCGVVVVCSSLGSETSLESSATKAGFFTFSFVEALGGKGDLNGDGFIFIHEATLYASIRVNALSQGAQNPTVGRSPHLKPFALTKK